MYQRASGTLELKIPLGVLSSRVPLVRRVCGARPSASADQNSGSLLTFPLSFKSFQGAVLHALSIQAKVANIGAELHKTVRVTLQPFAPFNIPNHWWEGLYSC